MYRLPNRIDEVMQKESFVFWDSDYTLLDESRGGMLLLTHPEMGFVSGSEEREPISGSVKLEIK